MADGKVWCPRCWRMTTQPDADCSVHRSPTVPAGVVLELDTTPDAPAAGTHVGCIGAGCAVCWYETSRF